MIYFCLNLFWISLHVNDKYDHTYLHSTWKLIHSSIEDQNTVFDGAGVFWLFFIFRATLLLHGRAYEEKKQLGEVEDNCCAQCWDLLLKILDLNKTFWFFLLGLIVTDLEGREYKSLFLDLKQLKKHFSREN